VSASDGGKGKHDIRADFARVGHDILPVRDVIDQVGQDRTTVRYEI